MNKTQIEDLLQSIRDLNLHTTALQEDNFFHILKIDQKEVMICRILGYLLSPSSNLQAGALPLKMFLSQIIGAKFSDIDYMNASINLEEEIDHGRRVDLVIYIHDWVFPIEVKIGASDQSSQLFDYYQFYKTNPYVHIGKIIYLTTTGYAPSAESIRSHDGTHVLPVDAYQCIAFTKEIKQWIDHLENQGIGDNRYRELVKQFREVVDSMSGNEKNMDKVISSIMQDGFQPNSKASALLKLLELNNQNDLWKQVRDKYLSEALTFDEKKYRMYTYHEMDEKADKYAIYAIDRICDGKRMAQICIYENLYIVSTIKTSKIQKGSDGGYWEYLVPTAYHKKKFPLRDANPAICNKGYQSIELDPYLKEISEEYDRQNK